MTASFKIIFATLVATAALVACTKDTTPGKVDTDSVSPAAEGSRVIAVSFASQPQTKTTLEGLQPKFVNEKDTILLYTVPEDENEPLLTDTCVVKVDGSGKATIYTDLTGKLKAIYPAKAAVLEDNVITAEILAIQSGKFADANIAGADIDENNSARFENAAPLLIITPPSGTKKLIVRSLRTIGEDGQRSEMACPINTSAEEKEQCTITVLNPDNDGRYYVTLYFDYDVKLSDLSFEAWFDEGGTTGSIKGIPEKKIKEQAAATGLKDYEIIQPGTAYTIADKNWHEYVEVGGHKWATMNVGAENSTDAGKYFAWGDTEGQIAKTEGQGAFDTPFDWAHAPFTDDGDCSSEASIAQVAAACPGNVLALQYDAANANWGGAWRMPTTDEYFSLAIACGWDPEDLPVLPAVTASLDKGCYKLDKAQEILPEYSGFVGLLTIEDSEHKLFFPAAGEGSYNGTLELRNEYGFYYSSTYFSSSTAYTWVFTVTLYTNNTSSSRCDGYTVRAIIDESDADTPSGGDEEESASPTDMEEDVLL